MRIARKFTLALVACVIVALTMYATLTVRDEIRQFEQETAAYQVVVGRALRPALISVWTVEGHDRALAVLREADQRLRRVEIRWIWLDAPAADPTVAALVTPTRMDALKRGEEVTGVDDGRTRIVTYVPVTTPGPEARLGALEVSQSLARETEVRRNALRQAGFIVLGMTLIAATGTLLLGAFFIGRPIATFVDQARRIGRGDLSYRIPIRQNDEFGTLAEELNRMCDHLVESQAAVARANEAKIGALEQLRHADRLATVGRLAAGMAHELGTPLNVVTARAKPIWTGKVDDAHAKDNARIIVEQVDRMAKIMRQLLDFARKRGLSKTKTDMTTVAARVVGFLEPMAQKHGVTLALPAPSAAFATNMDAGQIEQVLANLVMNAIQASPRGSTVEVEVGRGPATSAADGHPDPFEAVYVRVRDHGKGIEPAHLSQVFEPFFTTKEIGEGTGLGLSVAYGIVKDHGGFVHVESQPNVGSTFTVYIPVANAEAAA